MTIRQTFGVKHLWSPEQRAAQDPDAMAHDAARVTVRDRVLVPADPEASRYAHMTADELECSDWLRDERFQHGWWMAALMVLLIGALAIAAAWLGLSVAIWLVDVAMLNSAEASIRAPH